MRRVVGVSVVLILAASLGFWLWSRTPVAVPQPRQPLDEQRPLVRESKWAAPIAPRGERTLSGVVLRNGAPMGGIVVTALATQGVETLATAHCQSDEGPNETLTSYQCDERVTQIADWVASRAGEAVPMARVTTGPDGTFELQGLDDSVLTVWADGTDLVAVQENVTREQTQLKLELSRALWVDGTVKRFDQKSPAGVLVTALSTEHARFYEAVVDAEGRFRLGPLPEGRITVVAMHEELMPDVAEVREFSLRKVEFELSAPRVMTGVVLDGEPVAGAKVTIDTHRHKREVTTASDGTFTFKRLTSGRYAVFAESRDASGQADVQVASSEDLSGVTIELERGEPLDGTVVDEKGTPIADVEVSTYCGDKWRKLKTDAEGHFRIAVAPRGERSFTARKRGYFAKTLDSTDAHVQLVMHTAVNITGRVESAPGVLVKEFSIAADSVSLGHPVTDEDDPLDPADYEGLTDVTDSKDGTFSLDLKPGTYNLRVDTEGFATTTLEATAPSTDVVVTMKRGARLSGQVLGFDGAPARDVDVMVPGATPKRTDETGRFSFEGLTPRGEDDMVSAMARRESGLPLWRVERKVKLTEGELTTITLQPRKGVKLAGVVLDWAGKPLANVELTAMSMEGDERSFGGATTDTEGRFAIETLEPGKVNVSAMLEQQQLSKQLTAPDERVVLKMKRQTTLSGRVVDETGAPVKAFGAGRQTFDTHDGKFEIRAVKGANEVLFEATGFASRTMTFTAKEGPNDVGDVKLTHGRAVSGTVLDEVTRAPISGATVDVFVGEAADPRRAVEAVSARTDAQGRYRMQRVDPAATRMVVSHPDYLATTVTLSPSETKQDVTLKTGGSIVVKVFDAKGALLPRAGVQAVQERDVKNFTPTSAADGSQSVKGLPAGKWVVMVRFDRKRIWRPQEVEVGTGQLTLELREATDGIEVKVAVDGGEERGMALVRGDKSNLSDMAQLMNEWNLIEVRDGVAQKVPPGKWTLLVVREAKTGSKLEISSQVVEVPASGEFSITHQPRWRPVTGQPLFRSDDDDDE
jgi:hypothetical protein